MARRALARGGLLLASLAGRLSYALAPRPPWLGRVRAVFPGLDAPAARALAREVHASRARELYLKVLAPFGLRPLAALVTRARAAPLLERASAREPAILLFFHLGAPGGVSAGFERLGLEGVVLAKPWRRLASPRLRYALAADASSGQAAALKLCLEQLARGGLVLAPLDEDLMTGVPVAFLGREVRVGKGAAALARLSKAPVLPTTAVWDQRPGGGIVFEVHPPLAVPQEGGSDAFTRAAVGWFERYLEARPEHLRPDALAALARAPRVSTPSGPS